MKLLIKIPKTEDLLVQTGEKVDFGTPFFKKKRTRQNTVPLARILHFPADKIFLYLKKFVGETVKKGELIAEHKTFFSTKQYVSEFDGIMKEINHQTGTILLQSDGDENDTEFCFFKGEIAGISGGHIDLKVKEYREFDITNATDYFGGESFYMTEQTQPITELDIADKIVCASSIPPYDQVKFETLGTKSFVTLDDLLQRTSLPQAKLRDQQDMETINKLRLPYCIINPDHTTMYFYE